jgi:hypothetical protein
MEKKGRGVDGEEEERVFQHSVLNSISLKIKPLFK